MTFVDFHVSVRFQINNVSLHDQVYFKLVRMNAHAGYCSDKYLSLMLKTAPAGNAKGCVLYTGPKPEPSGYVKLRQRPIKGGPLVHSHVHRFIYYYYNELDSYDDLRGQEVSHLCHTKTCVNVSHLVLESHASNQSRITCAVGSALGAERVCCHQPPCIL